ncbi:glutathione S-transferase F9-like [Gossypium australe]|uniref:Glutathione S-transferase F9-like n=1 Tax=Gossypium australe TaxID=47621 RepID=A0A5B6W0G3_9ROSI|nr:glutathione S-transferase F9-like [Gossypium australe]
MMQSGDGIFSIMSALLFSSLCLEQCHEQCPLPSGITHSHNLPWQIGNFCKQISLRHALC